MILLTVMAVTVLEMLLMMDDKSCETFCAGLLSFWMTEMAGPVEAQAKRCLPFEPKPSKVRRLVCQSCLRESLLGDFRDERGRKTVFRVMLCNNDDDGMEVCKRRTN